MFSNSNNILNHLNQGSLDSSTRNVSFISKIENYMQLWICIISVSLYLIKLNFICEVLNECEKIENVIAHFSGSSYHHQKGAVAALCWKTSRAYLKPENEPTNARFPSTSTCCSEL